MNFNEIVSVSGKPGLKKIVGRRTDGLIISELDGSGKKFLSSRIHMFTPLENIAIFTNNDSEPLLDVMLTMKEKKESHPPVSSKASAQELKDYMRVILPDYDEDRVFISDIKKLLKWFIILEEHNLIVKEEESKEEESEGEKEDNSDQNEE